MSPRTEQVRAYWDRYAESFQRFAEPATSALAATLHAALQLGEARSVLEAGGGAGGAAHAMLRRLPTACSLTVTDLSPEMVRLARAALPDEVAVRVADAVELPFDDGAFDRYVCNLGLMIVPDTGAALSEAARVLTPGGLLAVSVWGRREYSPMATLLPDCATRCGLPMPAPPRSNFHLGEREPFRRLLTSHGFGAVRAWYQPMVLPVTGGEEWATFLFNKSPGTGDFLAGIAADDTRRLRETFVREADAIIADGLPIGLDALVAVACRT